VGAAEIAAIAAAGMAARGDQHPGRQRHADHLAMGLRQGILLLAILGLALPDDLQRVNALKNVLAGVVDAWRLSSSSPWRTWPGAPPH
jgi:hypothetical protein